MAYTTIDKPSDYFNTVLYTGTGSSNTITGVGFQPDLTWIKNRGDAESHVWFDAVRTNGHYLKSDATSAEIDGSTGGSGLWSAFASDGFTVINGNRTNDSANTYASWNWLASNTTASNTDGTITSTVSANQTAGFSIVSFNGQTGTVGHGLGVKPSMIILKCRAIANNWVIQHKGLTGGMDENALIFTTAAEIGAATAEPTTSVFTVNNQIAENNDNIAYIFADIKGYSKFGSYVGNGSTNGSYIHTGFSPSFVMSKRIDSADGWRIMDTTRSPFNVAQHRLLANASDAEVVASSQDKDFLSNGFKIRNSDSGYNASGGTYIYMAFAENPFVTSTGIPTTAR